MGFHAGPNCSPLRAFTFSACLSLREWKWATIYASLPCCTFTLKCKSKFKERGSDAGWRNLPRWISEKPTSSTEAKKAAFFLKKRWPILGFNTLMLSFQWFGSTRVGFLWFSSVSFSFRGQADFDDRDAPTEPSQAPARRSSTFTLSLTLTRFIYILVSVEWMVFRKHLLIYWKQHFRLTAQHMIRRLCASSSVVRLCEERAAQTYEGYRFLTHLWGVQQLSALETFFFSRSHLDLI